MRRIVTGSLVITAAAVALIDKIRNWPPIPARRTLSIMVCLLAVGLVVTSGCLGNSRGGPAAMVTDQTVVPGVTTAAGTSPATPADTPLTGSGTCREGLSGCGGFCRDLTTDIGNCGACGKACPSNSACKDSQCSCNDGYSASLDGTCHSVPTTTAPGCDGLPGTKLCDSQCVYTDQDPGHCGSCSIKCASGQNCVNGQCISPGGTSCNTGETLCNGLCSSLLTNPANCGACGHSCLSGQTCVNGQCISPGGTTCNTGETLCNGQCSNLLTNPANCGACGHSCLTGQNCINGQCAATVQPCGNGLTNCNGQCVNTQTDLKNCGKCNSECMTSIAGYDTGMICQSGQCTCPKGEINCGVSSGTPLGVINQCTDVRTDVLNCGQCGVHCTSAQTCSNGQCIGKLGSIQKQITLQPVTP